MRYLLLGLLLTPALGVEAPLAAQAGGAPRVSHEHRGFWIGFGAGGGVTLDAANLGGPMAFRKLGGTPSHRLLLGGELDFWARGKGGRVTTRSNLAATATFYPARSNGFFLKGGVGGADTRLAVTVGNTTTTTRDGGVGFIAGTGYEFRAGRNFYISPNADLIVQTINDNTTTLAIFTLGFTWH